MKSNPEEIKQYAIDYCSLILNFKLIHFESICLLDNFSKNYHLYKSISVINLDLLNGKIMDNYLTKINSYKIFIN